VSICESEIEEIDMETVDSSTSEIISESIPQTNDTIIEVLKSNIGNVTPENKANQNAYETEIRDCEEETQQDIQNNNNNNRRKNRSARVNLNDPENLEKLPKSIRDIIITSTRENTKLSRLNPIRIAQEIDKICGEVPKVEYCKTGSIIVTTRTLEQAHKLLKANSFPGINLPINTAVAWSRQLNQGKIYAPEFQDDDPEELLPMLRDAGIVGIRSLFSDSKRGNVPLYVLTFL
jgi:hypothetical protein